MGTLIKLLATGLVLVLGVVVAIFLVSEVGQEVVVLRTTDAEGQARETRLWIVQDQGELWLRGGQPTSRWVADLRVRPEAEIVRGEQTTQVKAQLVETPEARERINALIARDYGLAETLIALIHDEDAVVPIRLETDVAAGPALE